MKLKPLHDRVIVKRKDAATTTASGIIIPDTAKEKPQEGTVVAIGSGLKRDDGTIVPMDVKAGDLVLFGKYSGNDIKIDGEDLVMLKEDDIWAIIEG